VTIAGRLKDETAAAHDRLDARLDLLAGRDRYAAALTRFWGFYAGAEPMLDAWHADAALLDWPERRKLGALHSDLLALGLTPAEIDALPVRRFAGAPGVGTGLGWLYVLEGATLGGAVIARHLRRRQVVPPSALTFHTLYGAELGSRWRAFHTALARWVGNDGARGDVVVAGALTTFAAFEEWCVP
jgi:heme oxygenase (biliverdin-IX-beta and delta-forming)